MGWFSSSGPTPREISKGGRIVWQVECPESKCREKPEGETKSKCLDELKRHDKRVHQAERDKAEKRARDDAAEAERKSKREKKKAEKRAKQERHDKLRKLYGEANAKRLEDYPSIQDVPRRVLNGLHTHNIPGVPDGQNINGVVYDKDGNRVNPSWLNQHFIGRDWD
jgi:hypothetical protein